MIRYLLLVVFLFFVSLRNMLAENIGTIKIVTELEEGYSKTESPLQIKFVANTSFNESTNCVLQCSFDGRNTWNTIKHYEGSITQNCTLQVQYPDMLPTATDDNYFNNMGKDIAKRMHGFGQF